MSEFLIYSNNTHLFIYREKLASRYLQKSFQITFGEEQYYNFHISPDFKKIHYPTNQSGNTKYQEISNDYDLIINKESNKDVIIFYRDPVEKLKSGIIQDFYDLFGPKKYNSFETNLLFKHFNVSNDDMRFIIKKWGSFREIDLDILPESIYKFYKSAMVLFLEYVSEIGYNTNHCRNYLYTVYPLIYGNVFDDSKFLLFDIDSHNIKNLFNRIGINTDETIITSNNNFKKILDEILNEYQHINYTFESKIENELVLYNMIKLHNNNFK